jgi:CheY-like chemotaxis protein
LELSRQLNSVTTLMADAAADRLLAEEAFIEADFAGQLAFAEDGEELIQYLRYAGCYSSALRPSRIFLDLNMPRKTGHEALGEIKADPNLCDIPVVVETRP